MATKSKLSQLKVDTVTYSATPLTTPPLRVVDSLWINYVTSDGTATGTVLIRQERDGTQWNNIQGVQPQSVKSISADYTLTDADEGSIIEITGARTITIGLFTSAFTTCRLVQMDANKSTISGTYIGDYGQTQTQNVAGSIYEIARQTDGSVFFHISI